jgi:hypothetical protein
MSTVTSRRKYDDFTFDTTFAISDALQWTDYGLEFHSSDSKFIIKYIDDNLHFYVIINNLIQAEIDSSTVYNLFMEINTIRHCQIHFDGTNIHIPNPASVSYNSIFIKTRFDLQITSYSDIIKTSFVITEFAKSMEICVSNRNGHYYSRIYIKGPTLLKLLSLFYILDVRVRNKIVAHCLANMIDTYFNIMPTDILHFIFDYVV